MKLFSHSSETLWKIQTSVNVKIINRFFSVWRWVLNHVERQTNVLDSQKIYGALSLSARAHCSWVMMDWQLRLMGKHLCFALCDLALTPLHLLPFKQQPVFADGQHSASISEYLLHIHKQKHIGMWFSPTHHLQINLVIICN